MAENTKIEWCDHTFNPWRGCTKVAAGCEHCYAASQAKRNPGTLGMWGNNGTRVVASEAMWRKPEKWNKEAEKSWQSWQFAVATARSEFDQVEPYERPRVFCASMADVFEDWEGHIYDSQGKKMFTWNDVNYPIQWGKRHAMPKGDVICKDLGDYDFSRTRPLTLNDVRHRLFKLIDSTPNLDWLLLTKRPENILRMWEIPANGRDPSDEIYLRRDNVWLGTSISNQADADRNIPELLKCRNLASVLFVSGEPLLGAIEFSDVTNRADAVQQLGKKAMHGIDWLIAGGESGPHARPMHPDWARSLRDQCQAAGVPFFFKQWGEWSADRSLMKTSYHQDGRRPSGSIAHATATHRFPRVMPDGVEIEDGNGQLMLKAGKDAAGSTLDGREWKEFPNTSSP